MFDPVKILCYTVFVAALVIMLCKTCITCHFNNSLSLELKYNHYMMILCVFNKLTYPVCLSFCIFFVGKGIKRNFLNSYKLLKSTWNFANLGLHSYCKLKYDGQLTWLKLHKYQNIINYMYMHITCLTLLFFILCRVPCNVV